MSSRSSAYLVGTLVADSGPSLGCGTGGEDLRDRDPAHRIAGAPLGANRDLDNPILERGPSASGASLGGLLENIGNSSSTAGQRPNRRARRFLARRLAQAETRLKNFRRCGRTAHDSAGVMIRRSADGVAGVSGLLTCGSVWVCAVCSAKIMAFRRAELAAAIRLWQSLGGSIAFGTLTLRHSLADPLAHLWQSLALCWADVTSGRPWQTDKAQAGVRHWSRIVEVNHGQNGWHVHIHFVLFLEGQAGEDTVAALGARMSERWIRAAGRRGLTSPTAAGQDLHLVRGDADQDLAAYFGKDPVESLALEMTSGQSKSARSALSTRAVWALLDDLAQGDADALDLWLEYERVSYGRKFMTWSKGARDELLGDDDLDDDQVADLEVGTSEDDVALIPGHAVWRLTSDPLVFAGALDACEISPETLWAYLAAHGVEHVPITRRSS